MRSHLLIVRLALGAGLGACTQTSPPPAAADAPAGVSPLAQARIQMREVAPEAGGSNSTTLTDRDGNALPLLEPAFITTADIASVALDRNTQGGEPLLSLTMTDAAAPRIQAATEARIGRRVAFSVGDKVLSVATIQGPFGKGMQVSGLGDATQAQRMYTEITGKTP